MTNTRRRTSPPTSKRPGQVQFGTRWVDRDPEVAFCQWAIIDSRWPVAKLARESGLGEGTIRNIRDGASVRPQNMTISMILRVLRIERQWWRDGTRLSPPGGQQ
jgi:hypothetical protein